MCEVRIEVIILLRGTGQWLVSLYLLWSDLIQATDTFKGLVWVTEVEMCDVLGKN